MPAAPAVRNVAMRPWARAVDLGYRPEIDGLRAIAVVAVILFHGAVAGFGGGFVGVDVFFVISGYLITTICIGEIAADRFTISGFYERRARRILPALTVVVAASMVVALWLMTPDELTDFSESALSVAFFVSNFHFMSETGYFATAAELKPLLHTWSLAVEEQYYLAAPLALLLMTRFRFFWIVALTAALAVASLGFAEWAWRALPDWNFFLTPSRVWELMIGALAAFALLDGRITARTGRGPAEVLAAAGMAMILWSVFAFDATLPFPSFHALVPTLGTAAVVLFARSGTATARVLALPPLVGVGLISYSAYLWHQPLFAFSRLAFGTHLAATTVLGLVALTFLIGYLSWRFVERPFRDRSRLTRRQVLSLAGAASLALAVVAAVGVVANGLPQRYDEPERSFFVSLNELSEFRSKCRRQAIFNLDAGHPCRIGAATAEPSIAVWGDSHAEALAPGLAELLEARDAAGVLMDKGGCAPLAGSMPMTNAQRARACLAQNAAVLAHLAATPSIATVVLVARWDVYAATMPFSPLPVLTAGPECRAAGSSLAQGLAATACVLREAGKEVIVMRQVPQLDFDPIATIYDRSSGSLSMRTKSFGLDRGAYLALPGNVALDAVPGEAVRVADPYAAFCDEAVASCRWAEGGLPYYRDPNHLSTRGARVVSQVLLGEVSAPSGSARHRTSQRPAAR